MNMKRIIVFLCVCVTARVSSQVLLCDFDDAESNRKPFPCRCDSNPCQLTEISPDSYKWSPMRGKTPSDATGPDYDHTQQNDNGQYIYAEASQIVPGSVAQIQTPSFQLGTTSCLTFYYHMFGQHIGSLVVSAMFTNGSYGTLYTLDGEQGEVWLPATVILPENVNRVTFKATRGGTSQGQPFGDIALDDVKIIRQLCPGLTTSTTTTTISSTTSTTPTTSTSISRSTTPSTTTSSTTIPTTRTSVVTRSTTNPITRSSSTTTTKTTSTTTNTSSTTASPVSSTGQQELWGLDETLWIIILSVAGVVILVLLIIVCIQACAMRRIRTARLIRQSDDYSNIESYNKERDAENRDKRDNYINAYDNMALEREDKPTVQTNGGGLI